MMFPLVLDLADAIPVAVTCRVLGFSKQAFCQWKAAPVSRRDREDAHLINAAIDIHHDDFNQATGSPRASTSPTSTSPTPSQPPSTPSTSVRAAAPSPTRSPMEAFGREIPESEGPLR